MRYNMRRNGDMLISLRARNSSTHVKENAPNDTASTPIRSCCLSNGNIAGLSKIHHTTITSIMDLPPNTTYKGGSKIS
ncbi:hypothetical protein ACOME3_008800 [Neoechinorhynchus agilis]